MFQIPVKTTAERVQYMMNEMNISCQSEFGKLCGASRSVVYQWITGRIKNIDARYGFKLEDSSPFNARWIILGEGNPKK